MTSIPSSLARVPTTLSRQFMLTAINNTSRDLLRTNIELASGKSLLRPSDDAVAASTVSVLDDILERREQRLRNLSHAESVLNNVDAALADASDLVIEARGIGLSQIGVGSDAQTRENQALVIDAMLDELYAIGNRQYQDIFYFGGDATANEPFTQLLGGIGYIGQGDGLQTDLGVAQAFAITLPGTEAFGAMSARVEGAKDLNPALTTDTRLSDLNGARGLGVTIGSINADINGTDITVDLTNAHTIGDVINTLQADLAAVDPGVTVGIAASGDGLQITPSGGVTITISDLIAEGPASDLGISQAFPPGGASGSDLDPRITEITPVADLLGVTAPLGTIRLENAGQTRDLDLSGAQTVQDIMNLVDGLNIGIRVEIAESGDRLNFINELSGGLMSIGELGGGDTATQLGVRSLTYETKLSDFREGLGVEIIAGSVDPITGTPDPASDLDLQIQTKDGTVFDVDLAGSDTVQDVLDAINSAATAAGLTVGVDFEADLADTGNGLLIRDNTLPAGTTTVASLNGSFAAEHLGIKGSSSANLVGEDRAKVAVDSVFSHLIALRDALRADDESGITIATDKLESDVDRLAEARADVGVRTQRVVGAVTREQELTIQDTNLKSLSQDLDFTEASIRFANLQQQLQAALATTSQIQNFSLLDFLR